MKGKDSFDLVSHWFKQLADESEQDQLNQLKKLEVLNELTSDQLQLLTKMLIADSDDELPEFLSEVSEDWHQGDAEINMDELPTIGSYRLLELIGSGGMGHVYLAARDDGSYKQRVALKISQFHLNQSMVKRFENERQILAQLTHPNIAQLLDGGTATNEQPYLVMEYINGLSIDEYCIKQQQGLRERLKLIIQTCEAVSFAHQNLILHRDLKPANILVNESGQVKLLDFGIAKLLSDDLDQAQQTMTQIMTRNYASPEQIKGEAVTTQSDLFSLAIITYELVSGYHPYSRSSEFEHDQNVVSGKIKRITSRNQSNAVYPQLILDEKLKGDLENILRKALSPQSLERYESVASFADDIRNFLTNRPVIARKSTFLYTLRKFIQRQKALFISVTILTVCLILVTLFSIQKAQDAEAQRKIAVLENAQSNQMVEFLTGVFTSAQPSSDKQDLSARDLLVKGVEDIKRQMQNAPAQKFELMSVMIDSLESLSYFDSVFKYVDEFHPQCIAMLAIQNEYCQRLLITAGESAIDIQQDEKALKYLKLAEENARRQPVNQAVLANILRMQFSAYINLNQYDAAVNSAYEALDYYKNTDSIEVINIYNDLAVVATHQGRFKEAKSHYDSIQILIESTDLISFGIKGRYYANLSFFYAKQKQFDAAALQRLKGIQLLKDAYDRPSFSLAWEQESLAKVYFFAGNISSGIAAAQDALDTFEALNSEADKHIYVLQLFIAQMLVLNGEIESAKHLFAPMTKNSWDKRCLYELVQALVDTYNKQLTLIDHSLSTYEACLVVSSYPTKFAEEFGQLLRAENYFLRDEFDKAKKELGELEKLWRKDSLESLPLKPKGKALNKKLKNL